VTNQKGKRKKGRGTGHLRLHRKEGRGAHLECRGGLGKKNASLRSYERPKKEEEERSICATTTTLDEKGARRFAQNQEKKEKKGLSLPSGGAGGKGSKGKGRDVVDPLRRRLEKSSTNPNRQKKKRKERRFLSSVEGGGGKKEGEGGDLLVFAFARKDASTHNRTESKKEGHQSSLFPLNEKGRKKKKRKGKSGGFFPPDTQHEPGRGKSSS